MFILYAIPIGIVAGYVLGGRLDRLGDIRFRWGWLAIAGLMAQVILFSASSLFSSSASSAFPKAPFDAAPGEAPSMLRRIGQPPRKGYFS